MTRNTRKANRAGRQGNSDEREIEARLDSIEARLDEVLEMVRSIINNLPPKAPIGAATKHSQPIYMLPERIPPRRPAPSQADAASSSYYSLSSKGNEPLIEMALDEARSEIRILAMIPGVKKEDFELEVTENSVAIRCFGNAAGGRRLMIPLDLPVVRSSVEASFNNGVLEVRLELMGSPEKGGARVEDR